MPRYVSYYLSTLSPTGATSAPVDKSNLGRVQWNVKWADVFRNCVDLLGNPLNKIRLRVEMVSASSAALTWAANKGTLRIVGLGSATQNVESGVIVGTIVPVTIPAGGAYYLSCNTTQSVGVEIVLPTGNDIWISMVTPAGAIMANPQEYECILHFEIEEQVDQTHFHAPGEVGAFPGGPHWVKSTRRALIGDSIL